MEKNLTNGSVLKNLISFSLPFLLSYFLQTLYGLADLFIIGQFCDTAATTAVSNGSQVMHMLTVMIVGLAMGATVLIGKGVGSQNRELKNRAIGNAITLFLILSIIVTIILSVCAMPIVNMMSTPADSVRGMYNYLRICFIGIPFITMYNVIGSVFRGMGDSKSPMYFVLIACICNIALDYIFIGYMGFGAAGAALGTTCSQALSVIISIAFIIKNKMIVGFTPVYFTLDKSVLAEILKVGIPVSMQDGFIQVSFILITVFANMRGVTDAAAVGIVEKLIGILFLVPSTMLSSVSAICAQNIGAGRDDRARETLKDAFIIVVGIGLVFAAAFQLIAAPAVGLFSSDSAVIAAGSAYMTAYVWDCVIGGMHFVFSGYFCALGKSWISFVHNVISAFFVRIPLAYYFSTSFDSLHPMGFAAPVGSALSAVICIIAFAILQRQRCK